MNQRPAAPAEQHALVPFGAELDRHDLAARPCGTHFKPSSRSQPSISSGGIRMSIVTVTTGAGDALTTLAVGPPVQRQNNSPQATHRRSDAAICVSGLDPRFKRFTAPVEQASREAPVVGCFVGRVRFAQLVARV